MKFGQVFQSIGVWQKLARINLRPKIAFKLLRYSKLVEAEYNIFEEKRKALLCEMAGVEPGNQVVLSGEKTEEFMAKLNEMALLDADLDQINLHLIDVIDAAEEKNDLLSVQDLALIEPFFQDPDEKVESRGEETSDEDRLPSGRS